MLVTFPASFLLVLISASFCASQDIAAEDYCRSVDRVLGRCVPLQECNLFLKWLKQRPVVKQNVKKVVKFTCYFDLHQPKVCCPLHEIDSQSAADDNVIVDHSGFSNQNSAEDYQKRRSRPSGQDKLHFPEPETEELSTRTTKTIPFKPKKETLDLLPSLEECGSSITLSRHVGTFGAYPWIALLGYKDTTGSWVHVCSGSILNSKYILTSASCLGKKPITHIRVGEYDLITRVDKGAPYLPNSEYKEYEIDSFTRNPTFNPSTLQGDIALARVKGKIVFSAYIKPICLPLVEHYSLSHFLNLREDPVPAEKLNNFLVAGWGRLHLNSTEYRTLQETAVRITPDEECLQEKMGFDPKMHFCVGGNRRDNICITDAGGALMLPLRVSTKSNSVTPKVFLLGLFATGPSPLQCQYYRDSLSLPLTTANEHRLVLFRNSLGTFSLRKRIAKMNAVPSPSIYTKLGPYLDWILEELHP